MPQQISNIWEVGIVFALFQCFSHCLKKAFQTAKKTCVKSSINISPFLAVYCLHEHTSYIKYWFFSIEALIWPPCTLHSTKQQNIKLGTKFIKQISAMYFLCVCLCKLFQLFIARPKLSFIYLFFDAFSKLPTFCFQIVLSLHTHVWRYTHKYVYISIKYVFFAFRTQCCYLLFIVEFLLFSCRSFQCTKCKYSISTNELFIVTELKITKLICILFLA